MIGEGDAGLLGLDPEELANVFPVIYHFEILHISLHGTSAGCEIVFYTIFNLCASPRFVVKLVLKFLFIMITRS